MVSEMSSGLYFDEIGELTKINKTSCYDWLIGCKIYSSRSFVLVVR